MSKNICKRLLNSLPGRASIALCLSATAAALFSLQDQKIAAAGESPPAPELKLALLVGISRYKSPRVPQLRGPENDVLLIKELLKDPQFGFKETRDPKKGDGCGNETPESDIRSLCSEQATRNAILDAIDTQLISKAKLFAETNKLRPEDGAAVVFAYSGHGSYVKDDNGDEPDGYDETLVAYDADEGGNGQIRDDELNARIAELKKYTTNITFISDSCHSGSITRGAPSRGWSSRTGDGGLKGVAVRDGIDSSEDYVTISASLPNQLAREMYYTDSETGEEVPHGALTYNLVQLIRQYPGSTYREILNLLQNAMKAEGLNQIPTAEGAIDRVVFGSTSAPKFLPIFPICERTRGKLECSTPVTPAGNDGNSKPVTHEVWLPAGKVVGARVGGPVAAYPPGVRELTGEKGLLATGTIVEAEPFRSRAVISFTDKDAADVPENAQFALVSPFFASEKTVVAIDIPGGTRDLADLSGRDKVLDQIAAELEGNEYVSVIKETRILSDLISNRSLSEGKAPKGPEWSVAVVASTRREFLALSEERIAGEGLDEDVLYLIDRNGEPLYHFSVAVKSASARADVIDALEKHARVRNIRTLSNRASIISVSLFLKFIPVKSIRESATGGGCTVESASAGPFKSIDSLPRLKVGDQFYFEIINASTKKLYFYLYSIGADGKIDYFYPPRGSHELLPVGRVFKTYEPDCVPFEVVEGSLKGFESVKLIASTSPIQAEILESPSIARQRRSGFSPLEALLTQAATNTRGGEAANLSLDDWAALDFEYVVVDE